MSVAGQRSEKVDLLDCPYLSRCSKCNVTVLYNVTVLCNGTDRKDLEVLDLLVVAQGEHECLGITLTVPQQE